MFCFCFSVSDMDLFGDIHIGNVFLLFIITLISLYICFDEKILILIFFAIVAYTSQHIAHELYNLVSIVAEFNTVNLYLPESGGVGDLGEFIYVLVAVYLSIYALVYWILWLFVGRLWKDTDEIVLKNYHILIWAVIVLIFDIVFRQS